MSIFGSMKTAVSGMNAQANRLSVVSDNIANSNTTGYKAASTSFSSMVLPSSSGNYTSGGVTTHVRYSVSDQGDLSYTTSSTDLALQGNGFFIVQNSAGKNFLTRAGDFTKAPSGDLVNSAGFTLMGYPYTSGTPSVVVNGFGGLVPVNVSSFGLTSQTSTTGTLEGNLNDGATIVTGTTPGANLATSEFTKKTSLSTIDAKGNTVIYDVYFTKTAADTWDVTAYPQADAATTGTTSFPYASPADSTNYDTPAFQTTLTFDSTGKLSSGGSATLTNGTQSIAVDLSNFTEKGADTTVTGSSDGKAPSAVTGVEVSSDGIVSASYANGSTKPIYRIPLATVTSPDNLTLETGNVYSESATSGTIISGFPGESTFGTIQSSALEASNVDLAGELTEMIQAQRTYTANSKVFQTGSDLMDVLVNLSR